MGIQKSVLKWQEKNLLLVSFQNTVYSNIIVKTEPNKKTPALICLLISFFKTV